MRFYLASFRLGWHHERLRRLAGRGRHTALIPNALQSAPPKDRVWGLRRDVDEFRGSRAGGNPARPPRTRHGGPTSRLRHRLGPGRQRLRTPTSAGRHRCRHHSDQSAAARRRRLRRVQRQTVCTDTGRRRVSLSAPFSGTDDAWWPNRRRDVFLVSIGACSARSLTRRLTITIGSQPLPVKPPARPLERSCWCPRHPSACR